MQQIRFQRRRKHGPHLLLPGRGGRRPVDLDALLAPEHAARVIRGLLAEPIPEDWRNWVLHISDANGEEILVVPFLSEIGPLH